MRHALRFALILAISFPGLAQAAGSSTAPAPGAARSAPAKDGWPDTPAGAMARNWVTAFSTGEGAMRAFNEKELSKESLAKRSNDERMENYRKLRERFGKLTLASVVKSSPSELSAKLMDSDAAQHEFVFKVESRAPYHFVSVSMKEKVSAGHSFGGFHH